MDDDQPVGDREASGKHIPSRGWKIRFDSPPTGELSRRAEGGDILALFRAWQDTEVGDRRTSPRYAPAHSRAWMGWWIGARFFVTRTELVNLSKGGALVHLLHRPPTSQPVWICIGSPSPLDYVQARVLATAPETPDERVREFVARLEFHTPAPSSFFVAAGCRAEGEAPLF